MKKLLYDVYDGDKLFLQGVTCGELQNILDTRTNNLKLYVDNKYRLKGRYLIKESQDFTPTDKQIDNPRKREWAKEWDKTCAMFRKIKEDRV